MGTRRSKSSKSHVASNSATADGVCFDKGIEFQVRECRVELEFDKFGCSTILTRDAFGLDSFSSWCSEHKSGAEKKYDSGTYGLFIVSYYLQQNTKHAYEVEVV